MRAFALLLLAGLLAAGEARVPAGMAELAAPGFRILHATPPEAARQVADELVRARDGLAAWLGREVRPLPTGLPPLPVLLFADRAAFQAHARSNARSIATAHAEGYYSGDGTPGGGQLVLFRDGGRELQTARHELVHYLLDQILPAKAGKPVWFNEGLAECAERAWFDPGSMRVAAVPLQRHDLLRRLAAAGGAPLASITALGADGWLERAGADRTAADEQYTACYGAVLFLLNRHPQRFTAFLRDLAAGREHDDAYAEAFAAIPGGLDAAWRRWCVEESWSAARRADASASASAAVEHGLSWLPEHLPPGDARQAGRWLAAAARGFAATPGYDLDAAEAWLAAARALETADPARAVAAGNAAAEAFARRGHQAGQADALLAAARAAGEAGTWDRAAALAQDAVALAESVGPDSLRAAALAAYGACFAPGRAATAPGGGDRRSAARTALGRARELQRAAGEHDREAGIILLMAQALAPDDGAAAGWPEPLALIDQAEALWRALPDGPEVRADLARAAAVRGGMLRPDRNPGGSWADAAAQFTAEAALLPAGDARLLRNRLDLGLCLMKGGDASAAAARFAEAERLAEASEDAGDQAYAAYQIGWSLQDADPAAAAAAWERAAPRYRQAGRGEQEAMSLSQAAQSWAKAGDHARAVAAFARAAEAADRLQDAARSAYARYQQAWYGEPARLPGGDAQRSAALYAEAAALWAASEPARAAQAQQQRARVLTPAKDAGTGWDAGAGAWADAAAALAALPDAPERLAARGHALHQQAWCLVRGDGRRMTARARALFREAERLQRAGGDEAGARVSASWVD